ncbi:MAG TPA: tRNA lysidine(34) synthetase TilS [Patescibacteria group bacterium]|nr:tRNA lysidine(34) synthetase TilS [Patescibacteria group bacterium]
MNVATNPFHAQPLLEPGTYVVAVSGGVDSMVLLDMLVPVPGLKLTVAHFDHGIREDSHLDRLLVQEAAKRYGLPFVYEQGHLGAGASEDVARQARYEFLGRVRSAAGADAIVTAHHQDDQLETAYINILRGTNRRGLTSLRSTQGRRRPLLHLSKKELLAYAHANNIVWREDSTNQDTTYLRNRVRHTMLSLLPARERAKLAKELEELAVINQSIDKALTNQLHMQSSVNALDRRWFIMLPHEVAREVMATWLRQKGIASLDKKRLELITNSAKTLKPGKRIDVDSTHILLIQKDKLALKTSER